MATVVCPFCGQSGPNSYWLIDHEATKCPVLWGHVAPAPPAAPPPPVVPVPPHLPPGTKVAHFTISLAIPPNRKLVTLQMADFTARDSDAPATATVALTDAAGAPTTPDSVPVWAEDSNGTVVTLAPSADGLSCVITFVAGGTANITFVATDTDGTKIVATGSVEVTAGEAVAATISFAAAAPPA